MKPNKLYFERHINWVIIISLPCLILLLIVIMLLDDGVYGEAASYGLICVTAIYAAIISLVYKMDIIADEYGLNLVMGIGLIKKNFSYVNIESVEQISLKFNNITITGATPYRLGFFNTTKNMKNWRCYTMMYNPSCRKQGLALYDSSRRKRCYIIGTSNPEELLDFINQRIPQKK